MAKPDRKAPKGKPITSHQLFPAVVALWFAALFCLGSLAVRPALLESLIIRSRVDLIIPAAAPPLGVTARMLLALAMAALGAIIGAFFARRLARTTQEPTQRKRKARPDRQSFSGAAPEPAFSTPHGHDDAPEVQPSVLSSRRRALTLDDTDNLYVPHDMAPLPGGAPQIFAVTEMNLGEPMRPADAPLDLAEMALEPAADAGEWAADQWLPSQPETMEQAIEDAGEAVPPRQVFGMAQTDQFDAEPRQIFGQTVCDDHIPRTFIQEQGFQTSVFETAEAQPLFPPRGEATRTDTQPEIPAFQTDPAPAKAEPPASSEPAIFDLAHRLGDALRRRAARHAAARIASAATEAEVEAEAEAAAENAESCAIPPPYVPPLGEFDPSEAPMGRPFVTAPVEQLAAEAPPTSAFPIELPAALRPISLDPAESDEDTALFDSLLPPRHLAAPATGKVAANKAPAEEPDDDYGSLLDIGQSVLTRSPFVRITDDDEPGDVIEPVVIFPGQSTPAALLPDVADREAAMTEAPAPFRRFDAPAQAGQGQPIAVPGGGSTLDPAETERALRSALVNLQRISGAA